MDFFWLVPGRLAGGSRPGARRFSPFANGRRLADDLMWLQAEGIGAVLTITTRPFPADALSEHGFALLHLPVRDFTAPTLEQLATATAWIDAQIENGLPTLVHCGGGRGRTGAVLAGWLIAHGRAVEEAVAEVRRVRPGAVETRGQWCALRRYFEAVMMDHRRGGQS
jgi:hypothetical protein